MKTVLLSLALIGATQGLAHAAPAPSWSGTYVYSEDGGRTTGGTAVFVTHTLKLWKKDGVWTGRLESDGYQTYIDTVVSGKLHGNQLDLLFKSRNPETRSPLAEPGQRLFSLTRLASGGVKTDWGVFWPVTMDKAPRAGTYFRRKTVGQ
ncbi:hypothetical protein EON83_08660 [bacterium]|nr:MAG: hypothetical protein EON83_08660 [bacterium]